MTWSVALGLVFGLGWVPLFVFRTEALTDAMPSYTGSERFWVTATPVALALHMIVTCTTISFMPAVPLWRAMLGLALFGVAIAFWFWGRTMIGPLRLRRLPDEPPLRLRRDGAFGIVRHPLYSSYLIAAAAPLAVVPRAPFVLTLAACAIALMMRAVQEERRLRAQLGAAYDEYCRGVKRLIPFVW